MKIGVISDTHGLLRPEAIAELAGVEDVVDAGEFGDDADFHKAVRRVNEQGKRLGTIVGSRIRMVLVNTARIRVDCGWLRVRLAVNGQPHCVVPGRQLCRAAALAAYRTNGFRDGSSCRRRARIARCRSGLASPSASKASWTWHVQSDAMHPGIG